MTGVVYGSVVPKLNKVFEAFARSRTGRAAVAITPKSPLGLRLAVDRPSEVGADRLVNSLAAFRLFGGPVIILDFGTATTFDCVSKKGEYLGGAILPGPELSAKALSLTLPYTAEQIGRALDEALEANGLLTPEKDGYLRLVATRGVGVLGISPRRTWKPRVFIIAATISMYPREMYENGMPVIISSITRNLVNALPPRVKSLNYLNNILAKIEALDSGVAEAIMLNHLGFVAEATGDNLFIVRDGQLQTPPSSAGILEGITRGTVIR
ncbi:MAG: type III pantothenate kinase, partial [Chloroflexi bacterium]|nr:type III pantothenate kinase [Chloroflexota bacterium]